VAALDALPEHHPHNCKLRTVNFELLFRFFVRRVLAATETKLLELETAGGRLLVLRRRVIPFLALGALQCDNFPHVVLPFGRQFTVHSS
jgi:hypothetical protein